MSHCFYESMEELVRLPERALHARGLHHRGRLGGAEYDLGLCLLAWQQLGGFQELGYSSVTEYAEKALQISGQKLYTLLSTVRALEHLPVMRVAYREGTLCWSRLRSLQSLVTPETEHVWLAFARRYRSGEVARAVAMCPRDWKWQKALEASLKQNPIVTPEEVAELLASFQPESRPRASAKSPENPRTSENPMGASASACDSPPEPTHTESANLIRRAIDETEWSIEGYSAPSPATLGTAEQSDLEQATPCSTPSAGASGDQPSERPDNLSGLRSHLGPKTVRLTIEMTPDEYAIHEKAERLIRARSGKRLSQGAVLARMAEEVLNNAPSRTRIKHQIVIHTSPNTDTAWYETGRGILPVNPEILKQAQKSGRLTIDTPVFGISPPAGRKRQAARGDVSGNVGIQNEVSRFGPQELQNDGRDTKLDNRPGREYIPASVLRALCARSNGQCERCGSGGKLHIHHRVAVCEGGQSGLANLEHLCGSCHHGEHLQDFLDKPEWTKARDAAMHRANGPPEEVPLPRGASAVRDRAAEPYRCGIDFPPEGNAGTACTGRRDVRSRATRILSGCVP